MTETLYRQEDYQSVTELMAYPQKLRQRLSFIEDTSAIEVPQDPVERVVFQDRAKSAIRKIAQNRGHILMVGKPGTGKSMLANMFKDVVDVSLGDYVRPKDAIVAYPGKDPNHIRIAYENPDVIETRIDHLRAEIESARNSMDPFSLDEQIGSVRRVKKMLLWATGLSVAAGLFFPAAFIFTGLAGIGAIFMFMQENNHRVQEKIQRETGDGAKLKVKHLTDRVPEILYDPRKNRELMTRVSEPDAVSMRGGFRHDPYQSGNLQTPTHKRAYLGALAKSPIVYVDELKTLIRSGYMPSMLETMQNRAYLLEGGKNTGSGAADRSEDPVKAENIIIACCNHDTLQSLQQEGDGAFLSRIEDKGEIIQMESAVPETEENIHQAAQYIQQEILAFGEVIKETWGDVLEREGHAGVRKRSAKIFGKELPENYQLEERPFSRDAVMEIIKEMRCRSSEGKLSSLLRPINGIIKTAELEAILENAGRVEPGHVRQALAERLSIEGALTREMIENKKALKNYISSMTDAIGYVVGLAVYTSNTSGQMYGQPLPMHGQITAGGADTVTASGKVGDIAKAAAQNVRASIKKVLKKINAPYVGHEMHVEYIQAHGGVEGDSASVAMDVALISDYIRQPVNQKYGVTGSLTGDIVLAVGGVTEKVRSIMDLDLDMDGACVPWQNRRDIEPLLINTHYGSIRKDEIPGIVIYRGAEKTEPFYIYFCKTKYNVYKILMGLDRPEIEDRMTDRSRKDLAFIQKVKGPISEKSCFES